MSDKIFNRGDLFVAQQKGLNLKRAQATLSKFFTKLNAALVSAFGKEGPNWTIYH